VPEVFYHLAQFGGGWTSPAAITTKNVVFLYMFVMLLKDRVCVHDIVMKALKCSNNFVASG